MHYLQLSNENLLFKKYFLIFYIFHGPTYRGHILKRLNNPELLSFSFKTEFRIPLQRSSTSNQSRFS